MDDVVFDERLALDDEAAPLVHGHRGLAGVAPEHAAAVRGDVIDHRGEHLRAHALPAGGGSVAI